MVDDADRAGQIVIDADARALARRSARAQAAAHGSPVCMMCGDAIPEARHAAVPNCRTCFDCQDALERGMGR